MQLDEIYLTIVAVLYILVLPFLIYLWSKPGSDKTEKKLEAINSDINL